MWFLLTDGISAEALEEDNAFFGTDSMGFRTPTDFSKIFRNFQNSDQLIFWKISEIFQNKWFLLTDWISAAASEEDNAISGTDSGGFRTVSWGSGIVRVVVKIPCFLGVFFSKIFKINYFSWQMVYHLRRQKKIMWSPAQTAADSEYLLAGDRVKTPWFFPEIFKINWTLLFVLFRWYIGCGVRGR